MQFLRTKFLNILARESHDNPRHFLWAGILIFLSILLIRASPREANGLLIKNGLIVTAKNCYEADILIKEEKIIEIGPHLSTEIPGILTIDASGLQILPGGIDPHVHLADSWADDFTSGSKAALAGGITTIGHMSWPHEDETLTDLLKRFMLLAGKTSIADFFFHPFIVDPSQAVLAEIPELKRKGHTTLKIYMAMDEFDRNIPGFVAILQKAAEEDMLAMIHCEDNPLIMAAAKRLKADKKTGFRYYPESRPISAEVSATQRAVAMCEMTGAPTYIVHLSSERALRICEDAKRCGLPVFVETRPIYLYLTDEKYLTPDAPLYVGFPPLRSKQDRDALWEGLKSGSIQTLASDHAPLLRSEKFDPQHTIENPRPGMSNLQSMLPMLYSEGVVKGKIGLEKFVALTSTNAAKLFGLYPRKGTIAVGSDADLVLWDPNDSYTFGETTKFSKSDFSIFDEWRITGRPVTTIRRGEVVYQEDTIKGKAGSGKFISRSSPKKLSD
jgi:dihydropyrimidinase